MAKMTLEQVRVATPCHVDWDQMDGNDRIRFCSQCSLNVYNLSMMTRDEAESFVAKSEGRVCIRLYRRHDGTVITKDCPIGRRALHRQVLALVGSVIGAVILVGSGALASAGLLAERQWGNTSGSVLAEWLRLTPPPTPQMGDFCAVEPPAAAISVEGSAEEFELP